MHESLACLHRFEVAVMPLGCFHGKHCVSVVDSDAYRSASEAQTPCEIFSNLVRYTQFFLLVQFGANEKDRGVGDERTMRPKRGQMLFAIHYLLEYATHRHFGRLKSVRPSIHWGTDLLPLLLRRPPSMPPSQQSAQTALDATFAAVCVCVCARALPRVNARTCP